MRRRAGELPEECAISGCKDWAHIRGLCGACYSAWFRLRTKTPTQAKEYLYRVRRYEARIPVLVGARKDDDPHFNRAEEAVPHVGPTKRQRVPLAQSIARRAH